MLSKPVYFKVPFIVAIGRKLESGINLLGTAFAASSGYLITAAHVVGQSDQELVAVVSPALVGNSIYQDTTITAVTSVPVKLAAYDPIRDIAVLHTPTMQTPSVTLTSTDAIHPGDQVVAQGFPHTDVGRLVQTQHGSMVGAHVLLGSSGVKVKHVVLNMQARPGQSGSPVFTKDGSVAAMIVGAFRPGFSGIITMNVDIATLHQTTHAVSAEYIKDML